MSASLSPVPKLQFFTAGGVPLVGGKLYSYAAGTTTPLATYTSSSGATPNTNPVILNSRGEAEVWLGLSSYKLKLTDANDVEIWTVDNITEPLGQLAGPNGSSLIGFIQAGTGAQARTVQAKLRDVVSVKDFGATGDGSTPDTAAFQAAINYCQDNLKALYIPANNVSAFYKITAPLVVSKPLVMYGDGSRSVTLFGVGFSAGQYLLDIDGTAFGTYEQSYFGGFTLRPNAGNCMRIKDVSISEFNDIGLFGAAKGIIYTGTRCFTNVFRRINTLSSISGESFQFVSHTGGGQHDFYDCSFGGATGMSIDQNTVTDAVNFYACNFEQCTVNSFYAGGEVRGLGFYGCRTEGCDGTDFQINPVAGKSVTGIVIDGCSFNSSDAGGVPRISLGGAGGKVRGFNVNANSVGHGANNFSSYLVNLNGDGESGTIANNYLDGQKALCAPVNTRRANVAVYNNEANDGKFDPGFTLADGTWTPTDVSGAGLTFATAAGTYTKVGRLVFWQVVLVYPVTANTTAAKFSLPSGLAPEGGSGSQGRSGAGAPTTDSTVVSALQFADGVELFKSGQIAATNADLSGKTIYIGGTYYTAGI